MIKLNADLQSQVDAIDGQGSWDVSITPRQLQKDKAGNLVNITETKINDSGLYYQVITPENIQVSRVVTQATVSLNPNVALTSQLNNRLNPTMDNSSIYGGSKL
jgi:hypothetical protein